MPSPYSPGGLSGDDSTLHTGRIATTYSQEERKDHTSAKSAISQARTRQVTDMRGCTLRNCILCGMYSIDRLSLTSHKEHSTSEPVSTLRPLAHRGPPAARLRF